MDKIISIPNPQGTIYFTTEHSSFYFGEIIEGKVFIKLETSFPGSTVYIRLTGYEEVQYYSTIVSGEAAHRIKKSFNQEIYVFEIPIFNFETEDISPGTYALPFKFRIENTELMIPSISFQKKDSAEFSFANIKYNLSAYIQPYIFLEKGIIFEKEIKLFQRIDSPQELYKSETESKVDIFCLCCKKQEIIQKLVVRKAKFISGEHLEANLSILPGRGLLNLKEIKYKLIHNFQFPEGKGFKTFQTVIFEGKFLNIRSSNFEENLSIPLERLIHPQVKTKIFKSFYTLEIFCVPNSFYEFYSHIQLVFEIEILLQKDNIEETSEIFPFNVENAQFRKIHSIGSFHVSSEHNDSNENTSLNNDAGNLHSYR